MWLWHSPRSTKGKLAKVTKLADIVTSSLAVFETSISKMLSDGKVDEQEFGMLQALYLKALNDLISFNRRMRAENRNQFEKYLLEEINDISNTLTLKNNKDIVICWCFLCAIFACYFRR